MISVLYLVTFCSAITGKCF